jgi:GNAT superfamily N-acetyltransferase
MDNITIQPSQPADLPAMLELYQLSLGNLEGMRSEEYWRWKHEQNPFGASPVLLAWHGNQLIGLRAFMKWRFQYQGNSFLGYRAVDTATHPNFRGRGIFSKLTMALVEEVSKGEPALIFNTPNAKSKAGYLKMGWHVFGKTRLRIYVSPLHLLTNVFARPKTVESSAVWNDAEVEKLLKDYKQTHRDIVNTDYSLDYLRWRYQQVPVVHYQAHYEKRNDSSVMFVYRIKITNYVRELRVSELLYAGADARLLIRSGLQNLVRQHRPQVVTLLADPNGEIEKALPVGFFLADSLGLTITYRKVNDSDLLALGQNPNRWNFSAGTLELF